MDQPDVFIAKGQEGKVCKLLKFFIWPKAST
jgi:hypothetical protein